MNGIIRVFARQTSYTPTDDYAFYDVPPIVIPEHREVHVSCTFTWDRERARELAFQWEGRTDKPVRLGGPAFGTPVVGFTPGLYLREGIVFTTRGCNNHCPWCIVPGLEASLLDDHFVEAVRGLRIAELWLACDTDGALPGFRRACGRLVKAGFSREKIKCYVLIGRDMQRDEARLRAVYEAGAMPFAQLYRDFGDEKTGYSAEWNAFARMWQRPAATRMHMEKGTDFRDFHT